MRWDLIHSWTASAISSSVVSGGGAALDVATVVLGLLLDALAAVWRVKHASALSIQFCTHGGGVVLPLGANLW